MHLFHHSPLYDDILLILLKFRSVHEVKLIVALVFLYHFVLVHIKRDGQVTLEGEIRILNVRTIYLLILVEEIRVLEFLNGFMDDLSDPIVDAESSIFNYHLL